MTTAAANEIQPDEGVAVDAKRTALPLRSDTFLGVCEAIGQDFGFNPNWLRMAFAPLVLVSPLLAIGSYLGLGAVVALSHWLFPAALAKSATTDAQPAFEPTNTHCSVETRESEKLMAA